MACYAILCAFADYVHAVCASACANGWLHDFQYCSKIQVKKKKNHAQKA